MKHDPGKVYVLVSGRDPMVVKVGKTRKSPGERAAELERAPGYRHFAPYRVAFWAVTDRMSAVEAAVHRRLRPTRLRMDITGCQELFRSGEAEAVAAVKEVAEVANRPFERRLSLGLLWWMLAVLLALVLMG